MEKEPNLECPECHTKFYKDFSVYEEYSIDCPNPECKAWEEGCNNNLQYFRYIEKSSYDIEFQIKGTDLWIRVNDNIAYDENEAIKEATRKLKVQLNDFIKNALHYNVDVVNNEKL